MPGLEYCTPFSEIVPPSRQRPLLQRIPLPGAEGRHLSVGSAVSKAFGCNAGTCHGEVQGQNGFRLSLFGADPGQDHATPGCGGTTHPRLSPRTSSASSLPVFHLPKADSNSEQMG